MIDPTLAIDEYLDGRLEPDRVRGLAEWINASDENAAVFSDKAMIHARLCDVLGPVSLDEADPFERVDAAGSGVRLRSGWRSRTEIRILAAAVLAVAVGLGVFLAMGRPEPGPRNHRRSEPIATMTWADAPVVGEAPLIAGESLAAQTVRTEAGSAEFVLSSGATALISPQTQFAIHSPMSTTLFRGRATFYCPPSAKDFVVLGPDGLKVTDLGTRFSMDVDPTGQSLVYVTEGRVAIDLGNAGRRIETPAGLLVRIDPQTRELRQSYVDHVGSDDPAAALPSWQLTRGKNTSVGPGRETTGTGPQRFWLIDDSGESHGESANYARSLSEDQVTHPWRATAEVRVVSSGEPTHVLHVDDGTHRWSIWLDRKRLLTQTSTRWIAMETPPDIDLADDYHQIEMRYADDRVTFHLDGARVYTIDRIATRSQPTQPQVRFGTASSSGTGIAHWRRVEFAPADSSTKSNTQHPNG